MMTTEERNKFVEENQKLVYYSVQRFLETNKTIFTTNTASYEDLEQAANIALIEALDRYDEKYGVPVANYVVPCIIGQLRIYVRRYCPDMHMTNHEYWSERQDMRTRIAYTDIVDECGAWGRGSYEEDFSYVMVGDIVLNACKRIFDSDQVKRNSDMYMRYYIDAKDETLASVGNRYGLTHERVRQIFNQINSYLKEKLS